MFVHWQIVLSDAPSRIKPTWFDSHRVRGLLQLHLVLLRLPGGASSPINFCLHVIENICQRVFYHSTPAHVTHLQGEQKAVSSIHCTQAQDRGTSPAGHCCLYSSWGSATPAPVLEDCVPPENSNRDKNTAVSLNSTSGLVLKSYHRHNQGFIVCIWNI